jgi:hypothetical protein
MSEAEYLVGYGLAGEFGRFRTVRAIECERGNRVVVRTCRGVEAGHVLRPAAPGHARFLPNTTVGQLLRLFGSDDAATEAELAVRRSAVWERALQLADQMSMPLEIVDVEMLHDGEHVVLHHLCGTACDMRPFVSTLARECDLHILLANITGQAGAGLLEEEQSVGESCGNCGSEGGGCGSCAGGGCGSCGTTPVADQSRFSALREQMDRQRVSLI